MPSNKRSVAVLLDEYRRQYALGRPPALRDLRSLLRKALSPSQRADVLILLGHVMQDRNMFGSALAAYGECNRVSKTRRAEASLWMAECHRQAGVDASIRQLRKIRVSELPSFLREHYWEIRLFTQLCSFDRNALRSVLAKMPRRLRRLSQMQPLVSFARVLLRTPPLGDQGGARKR